MKSQQIGEKSKYCCLKSCCHSRKMTPSECFVGIDIILSIYASKVFINRSWLRWLMIVIFMTQLCFVTIEFFYDGKYAIERTNVYTATTFLFYPCVLVFKIHLKLSVNRIKEYFCLLLSYLDQNDLKSVKRYSWVGLLTFVATSIPFMIGYMSIWINKEFTADYGSRYGLPDIPFFNIMASILFDLIVLMEYTWETVGVIVYLFMYQTKYRVLKKFFVHLESDFYYSKRISVNHVAMIFKDIEKMSQLNADFHKIFSLYPLLLLFYAFFAAAGYITSLNTMSSYAIGDFTTFTISSCLILISIFITSSLDAIISCKIREIIEMINITASKFTDPNAPVRLILCLKDFDTCMTPSAYGWFKVDKSLILSFLGSVLTFAVLFKQIAEDKVWLTSTHYTI